MPENITNPEGNPEIKLDLTKIGEALSRRAMKLAFDERRGAGYLRTGAHARTDELLQPVDAQTGRVGDLADETLERAPIQQPTEAVSGEPARRPRRQVIVDTSHQGDKLFPRGSVTWASESSAPGELDDAYAQRRQAIQEARDFALWEQELASGDSEE